MTGNPYSHRAFIKEDQIYRLSLWFDWCNDNGAFWMLQSIDGLISRAGALG